MSSFFAILDRQVRDGALLMGAGLLLGVLVWLSAHLPRLPGGTDPDEVRGVVALFVSVLLFAIVGIGLGSNLVSRDLMEGRLGFFYARPISAASLWGGRILGALLVLAATIAAVWLPALLTGSPTPRGVLDGMLGLPTPLSALLLLGIVFCLAVSLLGNLHLLSVSWRVRSAWLVLEAAAFVVTTALVLIVAVLLDAVAAYHAMRIGFGLLLATLFGVAALGGLAQLRFGRSLPRPFHGVGAIVVTVAWVGTAVLLVFATHRLLSADADDILPHERRIVGAALGSDKAHIVSGPVDDWSDYRPVFLDDPRRDRSLRIAVEDEMLTPPQPAAAGRIWAWSRCERRWRLIETWHSVQCSIEWIDLDASGPWPVRIVGDIVSGHVTFALASDGHRLAYFEGNNLAIVSVPDGAVQHATVFAHGVFRLWWQAESTGEDTLHAVAFHTPTDGSGPLFKHFVFDDERGRLQTLGDEPVTEASIRRYTDATIEEEDKHDR